MSESHNPCSTFRTESMCHRLLPEIIIRQCPLSFIDNEAALAGKYPLVSLLMTDTTVAFGHGCDFGDDEAEFEGTAMTVAIVGPEFRGSLGCGHIDMG